MEELVIRHGNRMTEALCHAFPDDLQQELGATDAEMISLIGRCIASQMCNWVEMMAAVGIEEADALALMTGNVAAAMEQVRAGNGHYAPNEVN